MFSNDNTLVSRNLNIQTLPGPLAAPVGWRSEIIHSNLPLPSDLINNNSAYVNNYEEYNTTNTFNTSQVSSGFINNNNINNEYFDTNSVYRQQSILTDQLPPIVIRKTLPNNLVTYQQNVAVRFLQPPTPPPPGPLIIREVRPPQPPPQPPIKIREQPPPPPTPPPLVLRELPPPVPPRAPTKVVERLLPAPPPPERRVVIERFAPCPPKPSDVVIERWLPYKQPDQRRVLLERAPAPFIAPKEPNLLILHDPPQARVHKQFINQGVVRADPDHYLQRYGGELNTWYGNSQHAYIVDEASRAVPPPYGSTSDRYYQTSYSDGYQRAPSPYISSSWDRTRLVSPLPRSSSYHYGSSYYDSPYAHCTQSSHRYGLDTYRSYDDYPSYYGSYRTMTDVTPTWNHYCNSSSSYPYSSSYYPYSSSYPQGTIRVSSENEFQNTLANLTNGRVPASLRSY